MTLGSYAKDYLIEKFGLNRISMVVWQSGGLEGQSLLKACSRQWWYRLLPVSRTGEELHG